jgi:hypothetical protein
VKLRRRRGGEEEEAEEGIFSAKVISGEILFRHFFGR